jgi:hypothetical protein
MRPHRGRRTAADTHARLDALSFATGSASADGPLLFIGARAAMTGGAIRTPRHLAFPAKPRLDPLTLKITESFHGSTSKTAHANDLTERRSLVVGRLQPEAVGPEHLGSVQ